DAEMLRYALPELPAAMQKAGAEEEVWATLEAFAEKSDLTCFELHWLQGGEETGVRFRNPRHSDGIERELVWASFPIGRDGLAVAELRFGWRSDFGDVPPQSEILLQIAVDLVEKRLTALRSRYAPRSTRPQVETTAK